MEQKKIKRNMAKCKICGDIIESKSVHDFQTCSCEAISVDGGLSYLRRSWNPTFGGIADCIEELSEYEERN